MMPRAPRTENGKMTPTVFTKADYDGFWRFRFIGGPCGGCCGAFPCCLNACFCADCGATGGLVTMSDDMERLTMTPMWCGIPQGGLPVPCPCCNVCCVHPCLFQFSFTQISNRHYVGDSSVYASGCDCCPPLTNNKDDKFVRTNDGKLQWIASNDSTKYPFGMTNSILGEATRMERG